MTDEKLIASVPQKGLEAVQVQLFEKYESKVFSFLRYMGLPLHDAEDLTSEVFERAFKSLKSFDESRVFRAWLYQIMRNSLVDFRRSYSKVRLIPLDNLDFEDTVDNTYSEEDFRRLMLAMEKLHPDARELILLAKFQGMTYSEISEIYGLSVGAVKTRVHRILKQLTNHFKQSKDERL